MWDLWTNKQIEDSVLRRYVLSVVSGQESMVLTNLYETISKNKLSDAVVEVFVPEIVEVHITKKKEKKKKLKKLYPGYVFVRSKMNDKIWYILRNTPWVRLIIGSEIFPTPVTDQEIADIKKVVNEKEELAQLNVPFKIWNLVKMRTEWMEGVEWKVVDIDEITWELKVEIEIMGRKTIVTTDVTNIEKAF